MSSVPHYEMTALYLSINIILILLLVPGGFFMFRRYLRKMKLQQDKQAK